MTVNVRHKREGFTKYNFTQVLKYSESAGSLLITPKCCQTTWNSEQQCNYSQTVCLTWHLKSITDLLMKTICVLNSPVYIQLFLHFSRFHFATTVISVPSGSYLQRERCRLVSHVSPDNMTLNGQDATLHENNYEQAAKTANLHYSCIKCACRRAGRAAQTQPCCKWHQRHGAPTYFRCLRHVRWRQSDASLNIYKCGNFQTKRDFINYGSLFC